MIGFIDLFSSWLYLVKTGLLVLAVLLLINGLDDLFIDIVYWCKCIFVPRRPGIDTYAVSEHEREKPLALLIPAWREADIVGNMVRLTAERLDYENYHIFVGTYQDDEETSREVAEVCARYANVHPVLCITPGQANKSSCMNALLDGALRFERQVNFTFAGFVLHDAQDVVLAPELRVFNHLVGVHDVVRIPVYPYARPWYRFTGLSYLDKFAEMQSKALLAREALVGQVARAGAGCCFSRRAILALMADGDGVAFNTNSLMADYEIGLSLRQKGMSEVFCRVPLPDKWRTDKPLFGQRKNTASLLCIRKYYPETFAAAVRQKSRWIVAMTYQGYRQVSWTDHLRQNYILWRDRKTALVSLLTLFGALAALQFGGVWIYERLAHDPWHFLGVMATDHLLIGLLAINGLLFANRLFQRMHFVAGYYGFWQGLWVIPRAPWTLLLDTCAGLTALYNIFFTRDLKDMRAIKHRHDYPGVKARQPIPPLGQILVNRGALTESELEQGLAQRIDGLRLGGSMVRQGLITQEELVYALAEQGGVRAEFIDCRDIDQNILSRMPSRVALHYAVLPLRIEGDTFILAGESPIDPVSLAALSRKMAMKVDYVIVPTGQVVVGIRHWYTRRREDNYCFVQRAVTIGLLTPEQAEAVWQEYVAGQVLFAEVLTSQAYLEPAVLNALLLRFEQSDLMFGEFLVAEGVVSDATVASALQRQSRLQPTLEGLLSKYGVTRLQFAALYAGGE